MENLADLVPALRAELDKVPASRKEEIIEAAEILIKYSGYIKREQIIADKINRLENIRIKGKFDYKFYPVFIYGSPPRIDPDRPRHDRSSEPHPVFPLADITPFVLLGR